MFCRAASSVFPTGCPSQICFLGQLGSPLFGAVAQALREEQEGFLFQCFWEEAWSGPGGGRSSAHRLSGASREKIKWIQLARIDLDGSLLIYSSWGADPAGLGWELCNSLSSGARAMAPVLFPCRARARHTEQVLLMMRQKFSPEIISAPCSAL